MTEFSPSGLKMSCLFVALYSMFEKQMESVIQVQILAEAVCLLLLSQILGKGMNPSVLPPAMDKYLSILAYLTLLWKPVNKENSEQKPDVLLYNCGGDFFILSFFLLYILPFGLVRLRTFRLSAWVS